MKILNDPIYGFITVPNAQVLALIDHPWFQRLRYVLAAKEQMRYVLTCYALRVGPREHATRNLFNP